MTPPVTCIPWKPVMVKKHEANRLTLGRKWPVGADAGRVMPAEHQLVIFVTWTLRKMLPMRTVAPQEDEAPFRACPAGWPQGPAPW